jgi:hypothetical protein
MDVKSDIARCSSQAVGRTSSYTSSGLRIIIVAEELHTVP